MCTILYSNECFTTAQRLSANLMISLDLACVSWALAFVYKRIIILFKVFKIAMRTFATLNVNQFLVVKDSKLVLVSRCEYERIIALVQNKCNIRIHWIDIAGFPLAVFAQAFYFRCFKLVTRLIQAQCAHEWHYCVWMAEVKKNFLDRIIIPSIKFTSRKKNYLNWNQFRVNKLDSVLLFTFFECYSSDQPSLWTGHKSSNALYCTCSQRHNCNSSLRGFHLLSTHHSVQELCLCV